MQIMVEVSFHLINIAISVCLQCLLCINSYSEFDLISSPLPGLPDPFAKVVVDGSGQCHSTDTVRNTLDPKWNQHYDL